MEEPAVSHRKLNVTAYVSLGSNVGDRLENLRQAVQRIVAAGVSVLRVSSLYETEPVDYLDQPWFLNCVVEIATTLEARELMHKVQQIEHELGRERSIPNGPRTIDLDILLYGNSVIHADDLTIPHPRMLQRRFVLEPLRELAPHLVIPGTSLTIEQAHANLQDRAAVRPLTELL